MKILVVAQRYYPENFPTTQVCEQIARDGHDVTILTGLPNYPDGITFPDYTKGRNREQFINGVKIIRSFEAGRRKGPLWLAVNYVTFLVSSMLKARKIAPDFDCVLCYQTSPVMMACAGVYFAHLHKIPAYIYCCDVWPECMKVYIKNEKSLLFRVMKWFSGFIYKSADSVAVQSKSFIKYFKQTHNMNISTYIPQFGNDDYLNMDFTPHNHEVNFVFTGNIGKAQHVELIIEAANLIRSLDFKVHFVGSGSSYEEALSLVKERGLEDKILFYGRRPYDEMPEFYKKADVCLATLSSGSFIDMTIPAKIQGYFAADKPVLAVMRGAAKDIIDETKCGICIEPGDIPSLAQAMTWMIEHRDELPAMGERARKYYRENFTKKIFFRNLYKFIGADKSDRRDEN